jgi:signal transduction histidine kinase
LSPAATTLLGFALGIAIRPVSALLHAAMDQMLFGDRPDPLGAASRVVGRIGEDPADALKSIREALALPYLALRRGEKTVVESGVPVAHVRTLRLSSSVELDVDLVVGLRPGDLRLPADDTRVLLIVGPLIMQLARSQDLTAEVQASRAQAITAIADERRRLRRDLHDGLGPTLTGIAFATDAARNVARSDPDAVDALLGDIRQDTSDAITQIRALVYGMRPPALDDVGLLAALKQQAATLRRGDGSPLPVSFDVPEQLPPLPAAVEVAAYRIVIEALTNVTRHTTRGTAVVTISLSTPHRLNITVTDDDPHATSWTPGVGIAAMRERAAELDGTLTCGPTVEGGRVSASIPF